MKITGEIKKINEPKRINENLYKLDIHLISYYNKNILSIQFFGDNIKLIEDIVVGDLIECFIEITGREHNGKVFNTLNVKSIKKI